MALERITVWLDLKTNTFQSGMKQVRADMAAADGLFAKAKIGVKGFGDSLAAAAKNPAVLATAVAGVGAAAVAAVTKFADLALEAGRISDSTGVAVEDVSRLMEVFGDLGVSSSVLETALGFMNKTLGKSPELAAKFGIQLKYLADGSLDAEQSFLAIVDGLNKIKDPAKKGAAATALLGRGWKEMAEVVGQGSAELRKSLDDVSDAKVIDEAEVRKAREFREAVDNLKDKFEELALEVGENLIPVLTAVVKLLDIIASNPLAGVSSDLEELNKNLDEGESPFGHGGWTQEALDLAKAIAPLVGGFRETEREARRVDGALGDAAYTTQSWDDYLQSLQTTQSDTARETRRLGVESEQLAESAQDVTDAILAQRDAWKALEGEDREASILDLVEAFDDTRKAMEESADTSDKSAQEIKDDWIAARRAVVANKEEVEKYAKEVLNLPDEQISVIKAMIDKGQLAEAERQLAILTRNRDMSISIQLKGGSGNFNVVGSQIEKGPAASRMRTQGLTRISTPAPSADPVAVKATELTVDEIMDEEYRLLRAKLEYGEISTRQYLDELRKQQEGLEHYSPRAVALYAEIREGEAALAAAAAAAVEEAEAKKQKAYEDTIAAVERLAAAEAKRVKDALDHQEDAVAAEEAIKAQARALDELTFAEEVLRQKRADPKSKPEDIARAEKDVADARERAAKATVKGAEAQAFKQGLVPGTEEFARFVKDALNRYIAGHGDPTGILTAGAARYDINPAPHGFTSGGSINVTVHNTGVIADNERLGGIVAQAITDRIRTHGDSFLRPL